MKRCVVLAASCTMNLTRNRSVDRSGTTVVRRIAVQAMRGLANADTIVLVGGHEAAGYRPGTHCLVSEDFLELLARMPHRSIHNPPMNRQSRTTAIGPGWRFWCSLPQVRSTFSSSGSGSDSSVVIQSSSNCSVFTAGSDILRAAGGSTRGAQCSQARQTDTRVLVRAVREDIRELVCLYPVSTVDCRNGEG